jgi:hypothetical protein
MLTRSADSPVLSFLCRYNKSAARPLLAHLFLLASEIRNIGNLKNTL